MSINRLGQFEGGLYSFATTYLVVSLPTKISFSDYHSKFKFNTVQGRKEITLKIHQEMQST